MEAAITAVIIAPRVEDPTSDTEPVVSGAWFQIRPSAPVTMGGQTVMDVWSPVTEINGASVTVQLDPYITTPYELYMEIPDGRGDVVTVHEFRTVQGSGPVSWWDLTLVSGPADLTPPTPTVRAELDYILSLLGGVSGGATNLAGITGISTDARAMITSPNSYATMRGLLGAGTSNLAIGTTSTTAKAGNYQPTAENISNATAVGISLIKAADADAARAIIGAGTGSGGSSLVIGTTTGTAADGGTVTALATTVGQKANLNAPVLVNPTMTTQALSDSSTKGANTSFVQGLTAWAYGIQPRIVWTGIAWPSRAASIPPGYTGAVEYWSPYDSTAPEPTDALVKDLWTDAGIA